VSQIECSGKLMHHPITLEILQKLMLDIQDEFKALRAEPCSNCKLKLRVGINFDVIIDENDVYGNSVNIASHLRLWPNPAVYRLRRLFTGYSIVTLARVGFGQALGRNLS
jgi:hypothetical protein